MSNVSSSNGLEKYPKLRFKGFSEPWSTIGFETLFSYIPNNTLSRAELNYESGEYQNVHYGDVLIKYGPILDADVEELPFITDGKNTKFHNMLLQDGDVIIADTAEDEAVGKATEIINIGSRKVVSGLHTFACRPLVNMTPTYLGFYINSETFHKQLYSLMQGVKVLSISKSNIANTIIRYPCQAEQVKICSLLNMIEARIAKQRHVIELLKKYKRGAIRSFLMPETCPIKNAVWNDATIGELGTFIKGAPLSKADICKEGTPFILYGELYTTYGEVINKVVRRTQQSVDDSYLSRIGDVLIPTSGETPEEIATASCVMVPDVILAGDLNIFRTSKVDGRIMSYILNYIVNRNITRIAQGKSVVHIQASEISKIRISYPDESTQKKMIGIFDRISTRIDSEEKILLRMTDLKKSLLQRLFI